MSTEKKGLLRLGYWLPYRKTMTSVTYETPGALLEAMRDGMLSHLRKNAALELVGYDDFRDWTLSSGEILLEDGSKPELDGFVWFGEIGRDYRRNYHLELLKALQKGNTTVINNPLGYELAMDKYLTSSELSRHGIPVPRFMLLKRQHSEDAIKHLKSWESPILLKPRLGSYGIGIIKIDDPEDVVNVIDYAPPENHYVEQMIPNDPAKWIGINIIGGKHAYSYRKGPESFFGGWKVMDRKSVGGKMLLAHPSSEQLEIAMKIAELFDMAWVGVDMVVDSSGNSYVVDVNAFPGLYPEMFSQAGVDGPKMMADAVLRKLGI
ncbi:MAG: ATP-grasp domain-containing protein [Candidatus Micrarchaeota archaeon]